MRAQRISIWGAFEFKVKLSAVIAVINGLVVGLFYIASQGNMRARTVTVVQQSHIFKSGGQIKVQDD